jgi:hypothetical protein
MKAKKPTQTQLQEYEEWVSECPPEMQATARKWHPFTCYRDVGNPHTHYVISSYGLMPAEADRKTVRVTLLHGADSTLPGVSVFGVEVEHLVACNCTEWEMPTEEQCEHMREHFAALQRARACAPKKKSTPGTPPGSTTH